MPVETSVFMNKTEIPDESSLLEALSETYLLWIEIRNYVLGKYSKALEDWNYPGPKYGWSFRIKDKKRVLVYMLPRQGYFMIALVFGEKATKAALQSSISIDLKTSIESAKVYAEGRGFRIEVRDLTRIIDIRKLIDIKLEY